MLNSEDPHIVVTDVWRTRGGYLFAKTIAVTGRFAAELDMRTRAPADTKPNDEPWSQKELLRFQPVAEQEEWAACWRLTLCGLRRSEVTGLRWVVAARVRADDLQIGTGT
jgi:integrase